MCSTARVSSARTPAVDDTGSTLQYVGDQRDPVILDPYLTILHFTDETTSETIGLLVNWASHPGWIDPQANPMNQRVFDMDARRQGSEIRSQRSDFRGQYDGSLTSDL